MDKRKSFVLVKGYLLKEKKETVLACLFLCFMTAFLLVGNQLFINVRLADRLNAEALEGKQHVTYMDIPENDFRKMKSCPFVAEAGQSFGLGQAEDGTAFVYMDEVYRKLEATKAGKNVKQVKSGHWPKKEDEAVFTENYMDAYGLKIGDRVVLDISATDADTGDFLYKIEDASFVISGIAEDVPGFLERKFGYISEGFASWAIKKYHRKVSVGIRFREEGKIPEGIARLGKYMGYGKKETESMVIRMNSMLITAIDSSGDLNRQNRIMNLMIWAVCVLVIYNIFYNRFFAKKNDYISLRKLGFLVKDLFMVTGLEFLALIAVGFILGVLAGFFVNHLVYAEVMKPLTDTFDAGNLVSSGVSLHSLGNAALMVLLVIVPGMAVIAFCLGKASPVNVLRNIRKNQGKTVLALSIAILAALLTSLLSVQDNGSDSGIIYVKTYVPGDLQVTLGSLGDGMAGQKAPFLPDKVLQEIRENKDVEQIQSYSVDYEKGVFLCEEKSHLNKEFIGYYNALTETESEIDGKKQCLYNLVLASTDNFGAIVPSYQEGSKKHPVILEDRMAKTLDLEIGDTFTIYSEEIMRRGSKKGTESVTVTLIDTREDMVLSENHVGPNLLITDRETAEIFSGKLSRQVINIWADERKEDAVMAGLGRMEALKGCALHSARQQMQEYKDSDRNQAVMHSFFIVLLVLIGILAYFNTIFSNVMGRREEYSIMHKIGMIKWEMYKMAAREGLCHAIAAVSLLVVLQAAFCAASKIGFGMAFFIADIGLFVICSIVPVFILFFYFHVIIHK